MDRSRSVRRKAPEPTPAQLAIKPGDRISVVQDNGTSVISTARSAPWQLGDGTWVVSYEGRSGGFLLTRCSPVAADMQAVS
jgi:hypothetical protein